jgi:hypothetical protein
VGGLDGRPRACRGRTTLTAAALSPGATRDLTAVHPGRASPRRPRAPLVSLVPADARRAQLLFSRSSMDAHLTWRCRSGTYASCLTKPSWYAMSRWENDRTTGFGWAGHLTHAAESSFVLFLFSSFLSTPITKRGGNISFHLPDNNNSRRSRHHPRSPCH